MRSTNIGDVQTALVPFSKDVNVGTANVRATWIDWSDWQSAPANVAIDPASVPGSACPFTTSSNRQKSPYGYYCVSNASNGSSTVSTVPSSGLICPGADSGTYNTGRMGRYYNGLLQQRARQHHLHHHLHPGRQQQPVLRHGGTSATYTGSTAPDQFAELHRPGPQPGLHHHHGDQDRRAPMPTPGWSTITAPGRAA